MTILFLKGVQIDQPARLRPALLDYGVAKSAVPHFSLVISLRKSFGKMSVIGGVFIFVSNFTQPLANRVFF